MIIKTPISTSLKNNNEAIFSSIEKFINNGDIYCPKCHKIIDKYNIITNKFLTVHDYHIIKKTFNSKKTFNGKKSFLYKCDDCSASIELFYHSNNFYQDNNISITSWYQKTTNYIRKKYKINDIISVGITTTENFYNYNNSIISIEKIRVIIKGKPFLQCSLAVMQFTKEEAEDENTDNMDDHLKAHGIENLDDYKAQITMEEELFVHASNIQAFVENDYNMGILLESYSIPLLKELVKIGDKKAEYALYEQIVKKWNNGGNNQKLALFDKFPRYMIKLANNDVIPVYNFIINNFKFFTKSTCISMYFNELYDSLPKKIKKYINMHNMLKLQNKENKKLRKEIKKSEKEGKEEYKKIKKEHKTKIKILKKKYKKYPKIINLIKTYKPISQDSYNDFEKLIKELLF